MLFEGVLASMPFFVLGVLTRRWAALLVAPVTYAVVFWGLAADWWGSGLGDGWPYAYGALTLAGVTGTTLGLFVGRTLRHGRTGP